MYSISYYINSYHDISYQYVYIYIYIYYIYTYIYIYIYIFFLVPCAAVAGRPKRPVHLSEGLGRLLQYPIEVRDDDGSEGMTMQWIGSVPLTLVGPAMDWRRLPEISPEMVVCNLGKDPGR